MMMLQTGTRLTQPAELFFSRDVFTSHRASDVSEEAQVIFRAFFIRVPSSRVLNALSIPQEFLWKLYSIRFEPCSFML